MKRNPITETQLATALVNTRKRLHDKIGSLAEGTRAPKPGDISKLHSDIQTLTLMLERMHTNHETNPMPQKAGNDN